MTDMQRRDRLIGLADDGKTAGFIADAMGCSTYQVRHICEANGLRYIPDSDTFIRLIPGGRPMPAATPAAMPQSRPEPAARPAGLLERAEALAEVSAPIRRALEKVHGARDNLEKVLAVEEEKAELRRREAELRAELKQVQKELRGTPTNESSAATTAQIRKWAHAQGMTNVPVRGVLPNRIVDAYHAAHAS